MSGAMINGESNRKVRIKDSLKDDAGKGRVRIDPEVIKELKLKNGDVIEISHPSITKRLLRYYIQGK